MKKGNVTQLISGLFRDKSRIDTPKGTYTFALNAIDETEEGDFAAVSNEGSNEACGELPSGRIPIGDVYIGNNRTLIFSTNDNSTMSEIGYFDDQCRYIQLVAHDLGFQITHQIDATYRLRRGCETTVYWVDGKNNKPMYFVVEKPEQFKTNGDWDKNKFELQRSYSKIPIFQEIELQNSGGQIPAGSINIGIRYLDENLNPTEWITTTETIKVYNDDTNRPYLDIRGSINIQSGADEEDYRNFPVTDKSLRIELDNLDTTFLFYQLAFIEANSGTGQVTSIKYTETLPIANTIFIYTGENYETTGTLDEILAFSAIIESAGSIEQADNTLILGNVQGKQINYCKLQSYASRINADVITRKVLLNNIDDKATPKSPTAQLEGVGYQPGEIYSFGIVYVFADGTTSPVYHIPGKNNNIPGAENYIFSPGENVYPMALDNTSTNSRYSDNSTCSNFSLWGVDGKGESLKDKLVRHHRFPTRKKLGKKLVTLEGSNNSLNEYYQVQIQITGDLLTPCSQEDIDAGSCTVLQDAPPFQVRVTYTVDGVEDFLVTNINPADYIGPDNVVTVDLKDLSNFITSNNIVIVRVEESQNNGDTIEVGTTGGPGTGEHGTLTYTASVETAQFAAESRLYSTEVFGIKFSNVTLPDLADTNDEQIVGYYIVRNERTESDKTILDSAVLTPTVENDKYISHGLFFPKFNTVRRISDRVYGMIHPEHKFNNIKYSEFTEIKQEGKFIISDTLKSKARFLDVVDGTSYNSDIHKSGGGKDEDGWSIKAITRDTIVDYTPVGTGFDFQSNEVENTFYLDALQSRDIENDEKSVYNIAGDNKVGFVQLKGDNPTRIDDTLPYVYLTREIEDSYSTFRSLPYYKTTINMNRFFLDNGDLNPNGNIAVEFNGDSYVTPMRYVNTMWWDNRLAQRAGKTSVWNYIIGAILIVVGAVLLIFGGSGAVVIGAGIAVIGGGALFISSGIKRDALVRAYYDEYDKGLRETVLDKWTYEEYTVLPCTGYGRSNCDTPEDDEIQWIADCVTDLWFESQVNISLRYGMTTGLPTFMDAPGKIETGNTEIEQAYEHFGIYKQRDTRIAPFNVLDTHVMDKLTVFDPDRLNSRASIGHPLGEYYEINPDHRRTNKQKIYSHLPLEYDCCSECQEDFPHRVHWSQQAFQEELTDNFRVFLPNDYKDIEGETGEITDLFRIKNNIYIHTEEGLWHQPQNFQERVTGDVISFLGTGSYFNLPARKILDDNKSSAGTRHRWATLKTKHGVAFVSENENKIYLFDGNQLDAISDLGMSSWFGEYTRLKMGEEYFAANNAPYPYNNNPSNPFGIGFISAYDTKHERLIFSKKDNTLSNAYQGGDYDICASGGVVTVFQNLQNTLDTYANAGWEYVGIEDCRLKFEKTGFTTEIQMGETVTTVTIPLNTIVIPFYDTTSMTPSTIDNISATIDSWFPGFKASVNGGINNITLLNPNTWNRWGSENWVQDIAQLSLNAIGQGKDVLILAFVDESNPRFHGTSLTNPLSAPTQSYIDSVTNFVNNLYPQFSNFIGINYPIMRNNSTDKEYLQHTIAAIEGQNMTLEQIDALTQNPLFTNGEWDILRNNLLNNNSYVGLPTLKDYGWLYKENRVDGIDNNGSVTCPVDGVSVITPCQFTIDVDEVLVTQTTTVVTPTEIEVQVPYTQVAYVEGDIVDDFQDNNNSWTLSFSLKKKSWTSWHSYLPDFFYHIADKFYSWKKGKLSGGNNTFWRHNKKGHYQNFYGEKKPFIVEYTGLSEPLKVKLWDDIALHTEAKKYDFTRKQYVAQRDVTFNKGIFYNTRQCTGKLTLEPKGHQEGQYFMSNQVVNLSPGTVVIDNNEGVWHVNDIRDIVIDYNQPMFDADITSVQNDYYIDKVLNNSALDENKDWSQLESLRDKYLVVRLIFDKFDDVKLIMNYSVENETDSLN